MNYYFLIESSGREIGSNFPQSTSMENCDLDCNNGVYELMKSAKELPNFDPDIGNVVVESYAKLTDIISTAYFNQFLGKLLNQRALDVFLSHKIPMHKVYPVTVIYKGQNYAYYWLHIVSNEYALINFSKSKFIKTSPIGRKTGDISIKSHSDYIEEQNKGYQGYSINFEQLFLDKHAIKHDLFSIKDGLSEIFVSNRLKEALEANGVTGLAFRELPKWLHFE